MKEKIIIITGGSFQGKSLIALEVGARFNFSGVITTDTVRNVLKVIHPDEGYLSTSTYMLPESLLTKQMTRVSNVIRKVISIYRERGEHVVIEGMHFSEGFLRWTSAQGFCRIYINNLLPLRERIVYKNLTRSRLRIYDPISLNLVLGKIDDKNVQNSNYMRYQERINQIHSLIGGFCKRYGFKIIEFDDIRDGIAKATSYIRAYISEE